MKIKGLEGPGHSNLKRLSMLTDHHIKLLKDNHPKNIKKITEISHVGKFLTILDENIEIHKVSEKPDFILKYGTELIGLEHQVIVNEQEKEREGFFGNIFNKAETLLQQDPELPDFLANCTLKPGIKYKLSQKDEFIEIIVRVVKTYIKTRQIIDNPLIENILSMKHSTKVLIPNFGAWLRVNITKELIEKAISKKEELIEAYKLNEADKQWLLIVIGSHGQSSYDMDRDLSLSLNTKFDKVFILEDFNAEIFELK